MRSKYNYVNSLLDYILQHEICNYALDKLHKKLKLYKSVLYTFNRSPMAHKKKRGRIHMQSKYRLL